MFKSLKSAPVALIILMTVGGCQYGGPVGPPTLVYSSTVRSENLYGCKELSSTSAFDGNFWKQIYSDSTAICLAINVQVPPTTLLICVQRVADGTEPVRTDNQSLRAWLVRTPRSQFEDDLKRIGDYEVSNGTFAREQDLRGIALGTSPETDWVYPLVGSAKVEQRQGSIKRIEMDLKTKVAMPPYLDYFDWFERSVQISQTRLQETEIPEPTKSRIRRGKKCLQDQGRAATLRGALTAYWVRSRYLL